MKCFRKQYINLIKEFSLAGFKIKDQNSILGFLWSFLNPLIMSAILFLLFKKRMSGGLDKEYFINILIGIVIWNFFVMATKACIVSLVRRGDMFRNTIFPKEILIYSEIGVFTIQHLFEQASLFLFIIIFNLRFSCHVLFLPFIIMIQIMLITGLSLFLSCACVYVKDLRHIWDVVTRILFFTAPIFYNISDVSGGFKWVVGLNPISHIIFFSRDILVFHRNPSFSSFTFIFIFSLSSLFLGYKFFKHYEYKIAERV